MQNAVLPRPRTNDGAGVPARPEGCRNRVFGEAASDIARGPSGQIFGIDAPDDRRFLFHDHTLARLTRQRPVAIGAPAGGTAVARNARHGAPDLVNIVLAVELADQAAQAHQNSVHRAFVHRADLHALEGEPLMDAGEILHVARETIERLDDDHAHPPGACVFHQRIEPFATETRAAGARAIGMDGRDFQTFALGKGPAQRNLIVDRAVALEFG
nr:hypothetical protein [Tardibacter chloracetimidivorans]